jgi:hypothetical protein
MKLAKISCPIAFQTISDIIRLDSFLETSVEGMFPTKHVDVRKKTKFQFCELFLAGPFPTHCQKKSENVSAERLFLQEKQSWKRHALRWDTGWLAACHDLAS